MFRYELENGTAHYYRNAEDLYEPILFHTGGNELEAIEVSSWAELASIGETYYGDSFLVVVEEE